MTYSQLVLTNDNDKEVNITRKQGSSSTDDSAKFLSELSVVFDVPVYATEITTGVFASSAPGDLSKTLPLTRNLGIEATDVLTNIGYNNQSETFLAYFFAMDKVGEFIGAVVKNTASKSTLLNALIKQGVTNLMAGNTNPNSNYNEVKEKYDAVQALVEATAVEGIIIDDAKVEDANKDAVVEDNDIVVYESVAAYTSGKPLSTLNNKKVTQQLVLVVYDECILLDDEGDNKVYMNPLTNRRITQHKDDAPPKYESVVLSNVLVYRIVETDTTIQYVQTDVGNSIKQIIDILNVSNQNLQQNGQKLFYNDTLTDTTDDINTDNTVNILNKIPADLVNVDVSAGGSLLFMGETLHNLVFMGSDDKQLRSMIFTKSAVDLQNKNVQSVVLSGGTQTDLDVEADKLTPTSLQDITYSDFKTAWEFFYQEYNNPTDVTIKYENEPDSVVPTASNMISTAKATELLDILSYKLLNYQYGTPENLPKIPILYPRQISALDGVFAALEEAGYSENNRLSVDNFLTGINSTPLQTTIDDNKGTPDTSLVLTKDTTTVTNNGVDNVGNVITAFNTKIDSVVGDYNTNLNTEAIGAAGGKVDDVGFDSTSGELVTAKNTFNSKITAIQHSINSAVTGANVDIGNANDAISNAFSDGESKQDTANTNKDNIYDQNKIFDTIKKQAKFFVTTFEASLEDIYHICNTEVTGEPAANANASVSQIVEFYDEHGAIMLLNDIRDVTNLSDKLAAIDRIQFLPNTLLADYLTHDTYQSKTDHVLASCTEFNTSVDSINTISQTVDPAYPTSNTFKSTVKA